jgi:RNA polymerase sigma factor (sigma-70 family)
MTLQTPVDILPAPLRNALAALWARTGSPVLRQLLAGELDLADPSPVCDRRRHAIVCTCLMRVYQETGDQEAFALLFQLTGAEFLRGLRRQLQRAPTGVEPHDVLQEAFLNMCRYPSRFVADRADAFHRWGHRVVRNALFTLSRQELRQPASCRCDDPGLVPADPRAPDPQRAAAEHESAAQVDRAYLLYLGLYLACYEALPERDRRLLAAVEVDRRPYREIAAELGIGVGNVKMAVFRVRRRLERRMTDLLDGLAGHGEVAAQA